MSLRAPLALLLVFAIAGAHATGLSREKLEHYLSRAITMEGMLHGHGDFDDQLRMLKHTGVRFAGRTLYLWGGEENLDRLLSTARPLARKAHAAMPELVLQAAVFEIVTTSVETVPVPARAFRDFGMDVETRNFNYEAMLHEGGRNRNTWRHGASVPDLTRRETQLWFYSLAVKYIDAGVEAIHFGQVEMIGGHDPTHQCWDELLTKVRAYAALHARRGFVLCDGHVPGGGLVRDGRLLFDFHSFPLRIDEVPERPEEGVLKVGYLDSIFGRSQGGVTPAGWSCVNLPFLVELDNFGRSGREGRNIGAHWIWGYDEISWFAHQPRAYRDRWLRYAWDWVRETDPAGYLQMPGSRTLAAPVEGKRWYWASGAAPEGFGDEATIADIWSRAE